MVSKDLLKDNRIEAIWRGGEDFAPRFSRRVSTMGTLWLCSSLDSRGTNGFGENIGPDVASAGQSLSGKSLLPSSH